MNVKLIFFLTMVFFALAMIEVGMLVEQGLKIRGCQ